MHVRNILILVILFIANYCVLLYNHIIIIKEKSFLKEFLMKSIKKLANKSIFKRIDWVLIGLLTTLCVISVIIINSAMSGGQYSSDFGVRQILYYILGGLIAYAIMMVSPKRLKGMTYILYGILMILLLGLLILPSTPLTPTINGAKSWYKLGPISVQPSEFMKIVLILALAKVVSQHNKFTFNRSLETDVKLILKILAVAVPPMLFILLQNDLGTTLVICAILAGIFIVSGISWKILGPIFITAIVIGASLILSIIFKPSLLENISGIKTYQLGRINSWLDPYTFSSGDGYHLTESLKAIGSGQLVGKGINSGEVYIPENHTDFIFSVIGEELGFIGSVLILLVFLGLLLHLVRLALKNNSAFNKTFIIGYTALLLFHILQNVGMTLQLLPITGIPLPFVSYGGSALWSLMTGIGVILSIYYHESKPYEPNKAFSRLKK